VCAPALTPAANEEGSPLALEGGRARLSADRKVMRIAHVGRSGLKMTLTVPVATYRGVAVDVAVSDAAEVEAVRIVLAHHQRELDVVLFEAADDTEVVAEWRAWAKRLAVPMLMRTEEGDEAVTARLGALAVATPAARRMTRAFLKRRPRRPVRALCGNVVAFPAPAPVPAAE